MSKCYVRRWPEASSPLLIHLPSDECLNYLHQNRVKRGMKCLRAHFLGSKLGSNWVLLV